MAHTEEFTMAIKAMHDEAGKWRELFLRMATVVGGLRRLDLEPAAFFFPDLISTDAQFPIYQQFAAWQRELLTAAGREFSELGDALDRAADLVDRTDRMNGLDLTAIYGTHKTED